MSPPLAALLAEMSAEYGPPAPDDYAWADAELSLGSEPPAKPC